MDTSRMAEEAKIMEMHSYMRENHINILTMSMVIFFSLLFIGGLLGPYSNIERFEKECRKDGSNSCMGFLQSLDPCMIWGWWTFPLLMYWHFRILALFVVIYVIFIGQISIWVTAMIHYYRRPLELKKEKWAGTYLSWIFGYIVVLVVFATFTIPYWRK